MEENLNIGKKLYSIRTSHHMTQEEFGLLFHVTRQTVSNWENEKNYPDLKTLIMISDQFSISMDEILKNNPRMVETFDRERITGSLKRLGTVIHFCFGTGNGLLLSALASPGSLHRSMAILAGLTMIVAGELLKFYYKKDLAMLLKP